MGVNLAATCDWCGDFLFADVMKGARPWGTPSTPWDQKASVDANGWPTQDAGAVILDPPGGMSINGTYKLIFTGQAASITGVASNVTVQNQSYNASTNTTTADVVVGTNSQLDLAFTGTKRNPGDSSGTGITNVQLMLPTSFGSTTSYDPSTTFTTPAKTFLQNFRAIRFMEYAGTNNNTEVNWSDRRLPNYATQSGGGAWEYAIQIANETNTDAYINVPAQATDDYVNHLALLFKYGSDANGNVYTSTQSSPVHPPLNSNLHLYIEYSNEVWNGSFAQFNQNYNAAKAEVAAGNSPLNYDGETNTYYWGWRRIGERLKQISDIFRSVFGDNAMPNGNAEIRPVLEWQYGNAQDTAHQALSFLDDYYNNADGIQHVSTPHPINYFIWGGGGAAYSGIKNPSASTVDDMYNSGYDPSVVPGTINSDVFWGRSYGLMHDVAYEGGFQIGGDNLSALQKQANLDPRATQMEITAQTNFSQAGGELMMYFDSNSGNYGLAQPSIMTQNTPKLQAIYQLNQSTVAAPTNGVSLPNLVSINSGTFGVGARTNNLVISPSASTYNASLNLNTSNGPDTIQVLVNDVVVQTLTTQQTSQQNSDVPLNAISLPAGISAISFKGLSPTDTVLNSLTLSNGTPFVSSPTPTPIPIQQANVLQTSTPPTIDGSASDAIWSNASSYGVTHVVGTVSGFSASFQSAWDNNYLYLLTQVQDATFSSHNDAVEVYIDPTHDGGTTYDPKDMQYQFLSNSTTVVQYNNGQQGTNTAGIVFANATVSGGYTMEAEIPWSTLGVTASANSVIGLDLDVVQNATSTGNKLFWNASSDDDWHNPSNFGRATLVTGGTSSPTPTPSPTATPSPTPSPTATPSPTPSPTATPSPTPVPGTLPAPWQDSDIGSVGKTGSATYNNNVFTVKGSGSDIWGTSDACNYAYQTLSGDGTIVARVASLQNTNAWAKAGVMIRESLNANSTFADMVITPLNGSAFQYRSATGGSATHSKGPNMVAPSWVKLVRSGSTLTGYVSSNGTSWTEVGSTIISMANNVYIGLAVTAHNNTTVSTATFDNVTVS